MVFNSNKNINARFAIEQIAENINEDCKLYFENYINDLSYVLLKNEEFDNLVRQNIALAFGHAAKNGCILGKNAILNLSNTLKNEEDINIL